MYPAVHTTIHTLGTDAGENGVNCKSRMIDGCIEWAASCHIASEGKMRLVTVPTVAADVDPAMVPICSNQPPRNASP